LLYAVLPRNDPHGRTQANVNWICARCHVGNRPLFPGGMSTWNSAEFSDAMRGSCYAQLKCIDCHEPHRTIGPVWSRTPDQDDKSCLRCHDHYREPKARRAHTHHAPGSEGDRCLNCHMPRVNEGLDMVVRTHTILSPTKAIAIEKNGPNACNLCHLDRPIDWTLGYLCDWYGKRYRESEIAHQYPYRREPVGVGWLRHPFRATRLVAAAAYGRQKSPDILPELLGILDDPYLLNRQFGQLAVEAICGQPLEKWNYRFTQSPEERAAVLPRLRAALAPEMTR
jgi:predicted CXXCH cytochrome family protein